jgi:hypothetical protein
MNDLELRALVREAVARHLGSRAAASAPPVPVPLDVRPGAGSHPSHAIYLTVVNSDDRCVIEPGVTCNHCGYCKSHGH